MDLQQFIKARPRLYHLTARSNLDHIRATGRLYPAEFFYTQAGRPDRNRERRDETETVRVNGTMVTIRDQEPLYEGNCDLRDGWSFADLVEHLNRHVYFWPGTIDKPNSYGRRHFKRYAGEDAVVLVCDTRAVFEVNATPGPRFSRYNSGSPRCSGGRKSPRGIETFLPSERCDFPPGRVVECTFAGEVVLPWDAVSVDDHRRFAAN
jgi:hypothetical protein